MLLKKYGVLFFIFELSIQTSTIAQLSIPSDGYNYQQSFNTLNSTGSNITWTNGTTLSGWYASTSSSLLTTYNAGNGGSSSPGLWSYGNNSSSDRALGTLNNSTTGDIVYGMLFQNNSGIAINSITLSYKAEQWRAAANTASNSKGYHRVKMSYKISNSIDLTSSGLFSNTFIEIPELYMITLDTVSTTTTNLDGNASGNYANITVNFPVVLAAGQQIFIRFYDEDVSGLDAAMAVDDLSITFSSSTVSRITASSDYNFFPYADQGIIKDIPAEGTGYDYIIPSGTDISNWTIIFQNFYSQNWSSVDPSQYNYQFVEFYDQKNSKRYYILRKLNLSTYYWGTYVVLQNPVNSILVIQAPHPVKDTHSGRQASAVYDFIGAHSFMVAGISRCASSVYSTCSGQSSICGTMESYRKSDVAHNTDSMFHLATTILGSINQSLVFVQLHGFSMGPGDPNFIVSCGTLNAHDKSMPDYPVQIREKILSINSSWQAKIVHVDNYNTLGGLDNVQGRYLNLYPYDICSANFNPTTVNNRFVHIEQFSDVREYSIYYSSIANMLGSIINSASYQNYIPISSSTTFQYTQNFDTYATSSSAMTWGNNLSLSGWYAVQDNIGLFSNYIFDNGSNTTGGLYNYGQTSSTDRSLGTLNDDVTGNIAYGVLFQNTSTSSFNSITIQFDAKQWRDALNSSSQQKITMSYLVGTNIDITATSLMKGSGFTNLSAGDLVTIQNNAADAAVNGDLILNKVNTTFSASLSPGDQIFIRFYDQNETGSDRAMAIDNLSITFAEASLPVKWVSFDVKDLQGHPDLSWKTTNEDNCWKYEVLSSINGENFTVIADLPCKSGDSLNQYEFLDTISHGSKLFYYRIAQYDLDNQITYSPTLSFIRKDFYKPTIQLKDNQIIIRTDVGSQLTSVIICDTLGRIIYSGMPAGIDEYDFMINMDNLTQPILVVKIVFTDDVYAAKFLITNHQ